MKAKNVLAVVGGVVAAGVAALAVKDYLDYKKYGLDEDESEDEEDFEFENDDCIFPDETNDLDDDDDEYSDDEEDEYEDDEEDEFDELDDFDSEKEESDL